jgi:hypothetical protein
VTDPGLADRPDAWSLEFARPDGTGGFARLHRRGPQASFWATLVSPTVGVVMVRDDDLAAPARPGRVVVRGDGLWAEFVEETRGEHWTVGLEAFGVRLDDPLDGERDERGERLALGFDLEWETGQGPFGEVHGELLVATDRWTFDGTGRFEHEPPPECTGRATRRLAWQRHPDGGGTARDDEVEIDVDGRGLPTAARVGGSDFVVDAVVLRPAAGRHLRALVSGDAGCGWLEVCTPDPASPDSA